MNGNSKNDIQAIIIAGGFGTRLNSLFPKTPKSLVPLNKIPFIYYLLEKLIDYGIKEVIICTGFLRDSYKKELGTKYKSLQINYSEENEPLGTAGALKNIPIEKIKNLNLVLNGDCFCDFNFDLMLQDYQNQNNGIMILIKSIENDGNFGQILINSSNKVLNFLEKTNNKEVILANLGYYLIDKASFKMLPEKFPSSLEYDFFPKMIHKNFYAFKTSEEFLEIGTPESLMSSELKLKQTFDFKKFELKK
tara:strand:+ start:356 stop:1102 length:747 start_codon:yes stop_codon:yes gene_type:complete